MANRPKPRAKDLRRGDKTSLYIPQDISDEALQVINSTKYLSPLVIELIEERARKIYKDQKEDV